MTDQDPFSSFESDRTIIKPSAGRGPRPTAPASPPAAAPAAWAGTAAPMADAGLGMEALMAAHINPLVSAASALLCTAPRIRTMASHPNPASLKDALADGLRKFEQQARQSGVANDQVIAARYVLCTFLDESAASTPWGGSGAWSAHSLLVQFHNEGWGGEKVFQLMSKLAENIPGNRALLELMYVVLALGFEGRYRVLDNGRMQLDSVRQRLAQMLAQARGSYDKALSPHWRGVPERGTRIRDGLPLWVIAMVSALVLALIYTGLRLGINGQSDPVFGVIQSLDVSSTAAPPPPLTNIPSPRLAAFLKPEVDQGLVLVQDLADRSIVTIKGDGFFEPGSADIDERVQPLLARIAAALNSVKGQVLITGHTDNQPIRSMRFPSNWHLSQERANAVKTFLATAVSPDRLRAEGRADAEPVEPNDTPAGRSRNRRVEVTLFVQAGS